MVTPGLVFYLVSKAKGSYFERQQEFFYPEDHLKVMTWTDTRPPPLPKPEIELC